MNVTVTSDLVYAKTPDTELRLDLYRPDVEGPVPAVLYLHGGGWQRGDKTFGAENRLEPVAAQGIAVLSVQYRLVPDAIYPAQVHDVKAAVRWTRAHGAELGLDTGHIGLWGASAGAMLASLVGLTPGDAKLEGDLGDDLGQSSAVQAIVHWFGPADFVTGATRTALEEQILPPPVELALFGSGTPEEIAATAREASPAHRVSADAPPVLIMHGDRDRMLPLTEGRVYHEALSRCGANSTFVTLAGAGHEDPAFDSAANLAITAGFLRATLTG